MFLIGLMITPKILLLFSSSTPPSLPVIRPLGYCCPWQGRGQLEPPYRHRRSYFLIRHSSMSIRLRHLGGT